jgi:hypothetical protein
MRREMCARAARTVTVLTHEGGGRQGWQWQGHACGVEQDGVGHSGEDMHKGEGMHGGQNGTARARTKGRVCMGAKRDSVGRSSECHGFDGRSLTQRL